MGGFVGRAVPDDEDSPICGKNNKRRQQIAGGRIDNMITTYIMKIIWWALPKLASAAIDKLGDTLLFVEMADQKSEDFEKRATLIGAVTPMLKPLPESFVRAYIEFVVILYRLGVTSEALNAMEQMVLAVDSAVMSDEEKRADALSRFASLFPEVPERVVRLLIELSVAKIRSMRVGD